MLTNTFLNPLKNYTNGETNQNITTRKRRRLNSTSLSTKVLPKITGYITQEHLYAEATICKIAPASVAH